MFPQIDRKERPGLVRSPWDYTYSANPDRGKGVACSSFRVYEIDVYPRLSDGTVEACFVLRCGTGGLAGIGMRILHHDLRRA